MRSVKPFCVALLLSALLLSGCAQTSHAPAPEPTAAATAAATATPAPKTLTLGGKTFTGRETDLAAVLAPEDFEKLDAFSDLTSLDVSGSTCYEAILAYQAAHPEVQVRYTVQLGDVTVPGDADRLTLPALSDAADLAYLPELTALTVESPLSPARAAELEALLPEAELTYELTFAGITADRTVTALDLSAIRPEDAEEALAAMALLPQVTEVKLSADDGTSPWTPVQAARLMDVRPEAAVDYVANAFGVSFRLTDEVVSFNDVDLGDRVEELRALLPAMSRVGRLDMERCNIPDEQMAALRAEFPAPKIVWRVYVRKYSCRTDAIMIRFSQCDDRLRLHSEDLQPLTYCNEMRYLDLGHNYISDAFFVAYMPELEVCILAVEKQLTDISALANCPKLEYLEIFTGKVTDISALASCKNLKHLNMARNQISDISPLYELDLERLWLAGNRIPYTDILDFQRRFPNCKVDTNTKVDPAATWRFKGNHLVPRYKLLRQQFCYDMMRINTYSAFDDPNRP